jgi:hypothetical protein
MGGANYVSKYGIYLTAIGLTPGGSSTPHIRLTPGGSSTSHIYTQTIHIIQRKENLGSAGRAPSLRVIPCHLPYNQGKSTEKPQFGWHNTRTMNYNTQKKKSNTTQNNKEHRNHNRENCPLQVSKAYVK